MQFSEIPGLEELKKQLISAHKRGKVAHAQLFAGRPGTAVLPMALGYASYLMCENKTDEDSCGTCPNCVRIKKLVHPDIHLHFPKISAAENKYEKVLAEALPRFREFVAESRFGDLEAWTRKYGQENKNILISREDSRQMLKNVSMRSVEGGFKILLIWVPELMNPSSANAILKILEEPPEKTLYLLVSYNYDNLLATITSRTQLVNVPPNTFEEVQKYLEEKGIEKTKAEQASKLSEGKIGLALHIAEAGESHEYEDFQKWMLECWNKNLTGLVHRSEEFSKSGKAAQKTTLNFAIALIRNAVVHASGQKPPVQSESEGAFIGKFADKLGLEKLEKVYALANEALIHLERNSNPRITHLNLSLDITRILNG
ncbi:DNA polymerase III subunit delta [Ekhidna sp.]|jgi:DNA polymerase-3 subunit delta'|uniref:DNA polymerase III subunit n=1 Tax=Ekhidna sp. TaxID=2608089 RepID=UPI0032EC41ED